MTRFDVPRCTFAYFGNKMRLTINRSTSSILNMSASNMPNLDFAKLGCKLFELDTAYFS